MDRSPNEIIQADALAREGEQVLADLQLTTILATWGTPHLIGSMAMGLMVARDIDFNVVVDSVDATTLATVGMQLLPILTHPRVFRLRYASQLGSFNPDGTAMEEGFYSGIHYRTAAGDDWKIDVWTVQPPRPEIALRDRVRAEFTCEARLAALRIKRRLRTEVSDVVRGVHSRHVYAAVLGGVREWKQFERWLEMNDPDC